MRAISWENSTISSSSATFLPVPGGTTYLIAGEMIWGPGTTGHVLNLYNITDPLAAPPVPFATITADFDQSGIDTLGIRDRVPNTNVFGVDEIRFATTFADVMGIPEPSTALLGGLGMLIVLLRRRR